MFLPGVAQCENGKAWLDLFMDGSLPLGAASLSLPGLMPWASSEVSADPYNTDCYSYPLMTHEETKVQEVKSVAQGHTADWQSQNLNPDFLPPEPMIVESHFTILPFSVPARFLDQYLCWFGEGVGGSIFF